jgi:aspartate carbamoyltransferase catalytic subunit
MAKVQHLLDIESTPVSELETILEYAHYLLDKPGTGTLKHPGRLMINLFYEPSTRTRVSFEVAGLRLGMQVVNVAAADSSVKKGESLLDTFHTLQAMTPDVIVLRHPENGALQPLAGECGPGLHLVNAGDGSLAHPSQALLDVLTMQRHFSDLSQLSVLVAGDLHHSRVTRSGVALMKKLGVGEIRLCAPPGLQAGPKVSDGAQLYDSLDDALAGVDVVMMLRIQRERVAGLALPDSDSYHREWGLTEERLALASRHCIVMHPGPMNRGVEIASAVADGPQSVIREQVANGVVARMAVLTHLLAAR